MYDESINAMDRERLRSHARAGGDVLVLAEELGYVIDENFIVELLIENIPILDEKTTTTTMKLTPEDAKNPNIGTILKNKIYSLYEGEGDSFLIALAHSYKEQEIKRLQDVNPKHVIKRVKLPRYLRTLIRGIGLIKATSVEEIENFKLSEENEKRKKRVKFSYTSERELPRYRSAGRTQKI